MLRIINQAEYVDNKVPLHDNRISLASKRKIFGGSVLKHAILQYISKLLPETLNISENMTYSHYQFL